MRIPYWNSELKPQPDDLVNAILVRRGGTLLNLDRTLLWSEPLARGWNTYVGAVRTQLGASRQLRELGLVGHPLVFRALVSLRGLGGTMKAGEYQLEGPLSLEQIADLIAR